MKDEKVSDFEVMKYFSEYCVKTIRYASAHDDFSNQKNNHHLLSEDGKLALFCSEYLSKLDGLLNDLGKVVIALKSKKGNSENDYTSQLNYLENLKCQQEIFFHKILTVLDVQKLWVNDFYEINLEKKKCSYKNLMEYKAFEHSSAQPYIENYFKTFKHIIEKRNLNTHRAIFKDKEYEDLIMYGNLLQNHYSQNNEEDFIVRKVKREFFNLKTIESYREAKFKYVTKGVEIAKTYVAQFNNIMVREFFNKLENKKQFKS